MSARNPLEGTAASTAEAHSSEGAVWRGDATSSLRGRPAGGATLLEQMGGLGGLVASTLPVLVFVPVNSRWGMVPAIVAAVAVALGVLVWRIVSKENLQPAISGFVGVAISAVIALVVGEPKAYFAYGIWMSLLFGVVCIVSILMRWPLVGVVWRGINGEDQRWRTDRRAVRLYSIATGTWAVLFLARFGVQQWLYTTVDTATLGYTRIAMGWPLTAVAVLVTVWVVRSVHGENKPALRHAGPASSVD